MYAILLSPVLATFTAHLSLVASLIQYWVKSDSTFRSTKSKAEPKSTKYL